MAVHLKAIRRELLQVARAVVYVVHLVAKCAVEMVMVVVVRCLVAGVFARQVDRANQAIFKQRLDVAVHRGDTHARRLCRCGIQNFLSQ